MWIAFVDQNCKHRIIMVLFKTSGSMMLWCLFRPTSKKSFKWHNKTHNKSQNMTPCLFFKVVAQDSWIILDLFYLIFDHCNCGVQHSDIVWQSRGDGIIMSTVLNELWLINKCKETRDDDESKLRQPRQRKDTCLRWSLLAAALETFSVPEV